MKIFVIYAKAGAGHQKAAEALLKAYEKKGGDKNVELFDALDYTNPFFKWAYNATYLFLITYLPLIWGFFYYLLDIPFIYWIVCPLRSWLNFVNSNRLRKKIVAEQPDAVISVHFFASQVIARLISKGLSKTKLITVLTDFLPHAFWVNEGTHFYCVATSKTKEALIERGVNQQRIRVLGIPIGPEFLEENDKFLLRKKFNFEKEKFLILIVSGGFGVGPVEKMLRILDKSKLNIELAVVCGRNPLLLERLKKIDFRKKITVFGFVDNMHQLMKASDVIITKSGGMTVTEALASKLPMIIVRPVPGQETRNCFVVTQNQAAIKVKKLGALEAIIAKMAEGNVRQVYIESIEALARPQSAFEIVKFVNETLDK